jgi:hypothetical protein
MALVSRVDHCPGYPSPLIGSSWESVPDTVLEVLKEGLARFYPDDLSSSVKNSTYLQQHGSEGQAVLAAAWATQPSGGSLEQAEEVLFRTLENDVSLSPKVTICFFW